MHIERKIYANNTYTGYTLKDREEFNNMVLTMYA